MLDHPVTLFTYSRSGSPDRDRWAQTGIGSTFFEDIDSARQSVLDLREEVTKDGDSDWPPTDIEKIEIIPLSKGSLVTLLNQGVGAVVRSREIVETIS